MCRVQTHPTLPFAIHTYSEKAAYDNLWNEVTLQCRGLVTNYTTGEVLARPFKKFFNDNQQGQENVPPIPWEEKFRVFDKVDGSLGILVPVNDGHIIATRGSFTSDQALHATEVWSAHYAGRVKPDSELTYLFEILYPDNRVVLDYGDLDDLVLLGAVDIGTGRSYGPYLGSSMGWPGPTVEEYSAYDFDPSKVEDRPNKEGFVLWFPKSDTRVKIKHDSYLKLHAIVTRANSRTVWAAMKDGETETLEGLPDEFKTWVDEQMAAIKARFDVIDHRASTAYAACKDLPTRKDQALWLQSQNLSRAVIAATFKLLDGKDHAPVIWKAIEPEVATPFFGEFARTNLTIEQEGGIVSA